MLDASIKERREIERLIQFYKESGGDDGLGLGVLWSSALRSLFFKENNKKKRDLGKKHKNRVGAVWYRRGGWQREREEKGRRETGKVGIADG